MFQILDISKSFIEKAVKKDSVVADFTMGNGHDTEYLCSLVPEGKVYAFDIQSSAVENTRRRLEESGYSNAVLINESHAECEKYIKEELSAGMFNLGYLPGSGHKEITTMHESTLSAVKSAVKKLARGGIITINVYPGHPEGKLEGELLCEYASSLDKFYYCCVKFRIINSPDAPYIIIIERYDKQTKI